jgi:hypothetical protein
LRDASSTSGDVLLVEVLDLRHAGVPLPEELVQFADPPDAFLRRKVCRQHVSARARRFVDPALLRDAA